MNHPRSNHGQLDQHEGHNHHRHDTLPTAADMEARYQESELLWSGNPNGSLVAVASELQAGTALDIGCGEGADVAWLQQRGWEVLGIDFAPTAVKRCRAQGLQAELADFRALPASMAKPYDLVNVQFGGIPATADAVARLEKLVAPGGHLLFVHHDFASEAVMMPHWLAERLEELEIVWVSKQERHVNSGAGAGHDADVVLLARRPR